MSQHGAYSELKPGWWLAKEGRLPDAPKQVQVILADLCNHSCLFCSYRLDGYTSNQLFTANAQLASFGHNNPKRMMDTKRAISLLHEIKKAGALGVQFTGGGEPTVHPHHEDLFSLCLELGLKASLVSNGDRWSDMLIEEILPQFSWVRVSIDAGTQQTYSKIRRVSSRHWDRVWKNVVHLAIQIQKVHSTTALGLGYVVTPDSFEEIVEFTKLAKCSGAHNVRFSAMFSNDDDKPFLKIYDRVKQLLAEAKETYASETFQIYDNFGTRVHDLQQHSPDYKFCGYQWFTTYIGADLNPYRCCVYSYNNRGRIANANLKNTKFDDFWHSEERKKDFLEFDATGCERCQFNNKNRAINYMLQDDPEHKEFP